MLGNRPLSSAPLASSFSQSPEVFMLKYYNGISWIEKPLKIYMSGSWENVLKEQVKIYKSGMWELV